MPDDSSANNKTKYVERSVFSTLQIDPKHRYASWRESIGVIFDYDMDPSLQIEEFECDLESYLLGDLVSADCKSRKGKWKRQKKTIAQDGIDFFILQIFLEGQWAFEHDKHMDIAETGSIIVLDLSRTKQTWTSDFRNLSLCIPRSRLEPLLKHPDDQHGRILQSSHPMTRLLSAHMMTLHEQASFMTLEEAATISQPTLELVASVLNSTLDKPSTQLDRVDNQAKVTYLKRFIAKHLHDHRLNADMICKEMFMSRASLYRLSAPLGGVQNYIKSQRLKCCFNDLLNSKYAHLSLLEIGMKWGFNDASSFSRAFKAEFGMTPRDLRSQQAKSPEVMHSNENMNSSGLYQYETWFSHML